MVFYADVCSNLNTLTEFHCRIPILETSADFRCTFAVFYWTPDYSMISLNRSSTRYRHTQMRRGVSRGAENV
jgi:hypothetical protein